MIHPGCNFVLLQGLLNALDATLWPSATGARSTCTWGRSTRLELWNATSAGAKSLISRGTRRFFTSEFLLWSQVFISPIFRRFKIYSCPHCSDKYCTQEDLERHLLKVITQLHTNQHPVSEYQIDMRVLNRLANSHKFWILSKLTSSGREEQHSEGCANNSDPSGERTPESDAGADCCRRTGAQLAQILPTLLFTTLFNSGRCNRERRRIGEQRKAGSS